MKIEGVDVEWIRLIPYFKLGLGMSEEEAFIASGKASKEYQKLIREWAQSLPPFPKEPPKLRSV